MDGKRYCAIIVNYYGADDTLACIDSLNAAASNANVTLSIVVVDNSGEFGSFYSGDGIYIIHTGYNVGLARAWHIGCYNSIAQSADYIMLVNNDITVPLNFFEELESSIRRWGGACAFGPRILYDRDRSRIWSRGGRIKPFFGSVIHFGEGADSESVPRNDFETGHLSGCFLIIKREHFNAVGGVDTRYFFRGEEWDINYKLKKYGIKLIIADRADVFHKVNASHERFSPEMLYYAYRAKVLFAASIQPWWYFPLWYLCSLGYAGLIAPRKFARASGRKYKARILRRVLLMAVLHGWRRGPINPKDFRGE